jgi:type IV pilus assembly protein PilW
MSLVEVMVASVIGLMTILAVTQTMSFSETQRRITTGSGNAQTNVTLSTYLLEREVRMAGYGVFANDANFVNQCMRGTVRAYNTARNPADIVYAFDKVPFVPVVINPAGIPEGDEGSDVLGVAYSNSGIGLSGLGIRIDNDTGQGLAVVNTAGIVTGDIVLAVSTTAGTDCSVHEITDGPGSVHCSGASAAAVLQYGQSAYPSTHHACKEVLPTRNKPGGYGIDTSLYNNGLYFNLGQRDGLIYAYYAVRNGRLVRCDYQRSNCADDKAVDNALVWTPIGDGIVTLRAELGISSTGIDGAVDIWRTTVCATAGCNPTQTDWNNLRLVRLALVGRSQQPAATGTTVESPGWGGQTPLDLSVLGTNWSNFRYVKTEVVIPLRNIVWGSTS